MKTPQYIKDQIDKKTEAFYQAFHPTGGTLPQSDPSLYPTTRKTMWIQNVSLADIEKGYHYDAGPNSMLIQIVDGGLEFPVPKYPFKETHQFVFFDVEPGDANWNDLQDGAISTEDAARIASLLIRARKNSMNVIVHCVAGICRSGAVAEAGIAAVGLTDTETYRLPNGYVFRMIIDELHKLQWFDTIEGRQVFNNRSAKDV